MPPLALPIRRDQGADLPVIRSTCIVSTRSRRGHSDRKAAVIDAELASNKGMPFRATTDGENVSGTVQPSSGKFAVVEKFHEFTLASRRPGIDRQLGHEVMGVMQGGSVSGSWKCRGGAIFDLIKF